MLNQHTLTYSTIDRKDYRSYKSNPEICLRILHKINETPESRYSVCMAKP
ncbi:YyzL [Bacillus subtilis subsp. subtilis 6051-HGW]|nr:YyzL [Bacillus subtilis subsp. subtilis 6051-HGW]